MRHWLKGVYSVSHDWRGKKTDKVDRETIHKIFVQTAVCCDTGSLTKTHKYAMLESSINNLGPWKNREIHGSYLWHYDSCSASKSNQRSSGGDILSNLQVSVHIPQPVFNRANKGGGILGVDWPPPSTVESNILHDQFIYNTKSKIEGLRAFHWYHMQQCCYR